MVSEDYGKGWPVRQVSCGQCEKNFRHVKRVKASYGNRERLRSRVISAVKWARSSSLIAINFKPRRSGRTFRTMASVRICPSGARKLRWTFSPTAIRSDFSIERQRPPTLTSSTRERPSCFLQFQNTHKSGGPATREVNLREGFWPDSTASPCNLCLGAGGALKNKARRV